MRNILLHICMTSTETYQQHLSHEYELFVHFKQTPQSDTQFRLEQSHTTQHTPHTTYHIPHPIRSFVGKGSEYQRTIEG